MHTFDTCAKPSARSGEALLNSAASSDPRSIVCTTSALGKALATAPRLLNRSIAIPAVRYLSPLRSSTLAIGFLNQPSGCVGCGPYRNDTTLAPIDA